MPEVTRVVLPETLVTPNVRTDAIDRAAWVWHPTVDGWTNRFVACGNRGQLQSFPSGWTTNVFLRFVNEVNVTNAPVRLRFHVSADERFVLTLDGTIVSRGPHRGTVSHWLYQTYDVTLEKGRHVFNAVVWRIGASAPAAQLTFQGGFIFAAECADREIAEALLTGGKKSTWRVSDIGGPDRKCWAWGGGFTGGCMRFAGKCPFYERWDDEAFVAPCVVRRSAQGGYSCGFRQPGWTLEPSPLPDMTTPFRSAGTVKAILREGWFWNHTITEADTKDPEIAKWNDFLSGKTKSLVLPAGTHRVLYCDLGEYTTGFPEVETGSRANGAIDFGFDERPRWPAPKEGEKQKPHPNRNACIGLQIPAWIGSSSALLKPNFTPTAFWWGSGKWLAINFNSWGETELKRLGVREDRYPLEYEASFACDDRELDAVQKICARTVQMCAHETMMDCPGFEQQMYPGDTRVQLVALSAMTRDDRMIRRAITIFDQSRDDEGFIRMNYPCWMSQNSASYTLCWILMLKDYALWHDNEPWLRARLPGLRQTMSAYEKWEAPDGTLREMPYWNFMDWAGNGTDGGAVDCLMDLYHLLAMDSVAFVERALGNELQAQYWEAKMAKKRPAVLKRYWDEKRGLLASVPLPEKGEVPYWEWRYTEHCQVLGVLTGVLDAGKTARVMKTIETDDATILKETKLHFARCSVYFSHYLFEMFKKLGRTDLTYKGFDLWRGYLAEGLTTCVESPGKNARSDCHAWGAHPIYQLHSAFAGVEPAAPFFAKVRVKPQPASMKFVKAKTPHPKGWVETDLAFDGKGGVTGAVTLPAGVSGEFVWQGKTSPLAPGRNEITR